MSDLIERQSVIDAIKVAYFNRDIQSAKDDQCIVDAMTDWAIRQVRQVPTAEERKTGHWILDIHSCDDNGNGFYTCSVCGAGDTHALTMYVPYCWKCGARMLRTEVE